MLVTINGKPSFQITSDYGTIDAVHKLPHTGIDLAMPIGTDVLSPVNGIISRIIDMGNENIGKAIVIKVKNGNELIFGHLSSFDVKAGDAVSIGQKVAESGNTGYSTGAHLHIGLKTISGEFVDPKYYEQIFQKVSENPQLASATKGSIFDLLTNGISDNNSLARDFIDAVGFLKEFIRDIKAGGVWYAFSGETFGQWFLQVSKNFGFFLLENNDFFLLAPAISFMFLTFFIGKNKYARYILPLFFFYFITEVLHNKLLAAGVKCLPMP